MPDDVQRTSSTHAISSHTAASMDHEMRSHLIGCAKIRELELRLEEHFKDIESRLGDVKLLNLLKQKVLEGGDSFDGSKDEDFKKLLDKARELGVDWKPNGWKSKDERDQLMNALHLQITSRESDNQTMFMRINRLMNLRSEAANLFSKMVSDSHNQSIRVLSRIEKK